MYPVSTEYKNKIKERVRILSCQIEIEHSQGTLTLTDKDLALGSLSYSEGSQAGDEFTIGSTVASDISFSIINKPGYADIDFEGATVIPSIGLLLSDEEDLWEYVPLGVFNIDDPVRLRNTIQIKAMDNMIKFDKPYSLSQLSYPATLYQIYLDACDVCDVQPGTFDFPNKNYLVQERPDDDLTLRDIVGYVAELSGSFAKINRTGALELKWYTPTDLEIGPMNRYNFKPKDYQIQIKGISYSTEDAVYLAGSDEYVIDLSENPLINVDSDYGTLLNNIYNNVKNTIFVPYESSWQGNPAVEAGDIIVQKDKDNNVYHTLITNATYKYRKASTLSAKGLPEQVRGFKGSASKKIANIIRKEIKPLGNELTHLQQAQVNAMNLMANMLGGYTHIEEDAFYISDSPILQNSTRIWKWGIGGFGYSDDGGQTWQTAITADGSIVAMLVAANIITADMIKAGTLQSLEGNIRISLSNDTLLIGNSIEDYRFYFDGNNLKINLANGEPLDETIGAIEDKVVDIEEDMTNWSTLAATKAELGEVITSLNIYREALEKAEIDLVTATDEIANLLQRVPAIELQLGNFVQSLQFVDTYMRLGEEGLIIGSKTGATAIRITDDRIDFLDGSGEPVAYITNQIMRINRGIFVDSAQIGGHKIETIAGGHTVFTWVEHSLPYIPIEFEGFYRYMEYYDIPTEWGVASTLTILEPYTYYEFHTNVPSTERPESGELVRLGPVGYVVGEEPYESPTTPKVFVDNADILGQMFNPDYDTPFIEGSPVVFRTDEYGRVQFPMNDWLMNRFRDGIYEIKALKLYESGW